MHENMCPLIIWRTALIKKKLAKMPKIGEPQHSTDSPNVYYECTSIMSRNIHTYAVIKGMIWKQN